MSSRSDYRRALVASQFHRAHRRAAMEILLSRLSGQPVDLLSFNDVIGKLGNVGQSHIGIRQIPLDAIVGSVGRYQDFTRTFLPRLQNDEDRWVSVGSAAPTVADLPPIEVYKIGDSYFVLDGNHRVSLARMQELPEIDANVIEVRTRVPMPPGAKPDDLIIAAELGSFLAYTRLDVLRPDSEFQVSVPGQHRHLESHIEAYRFIQESREERDWPYEEAAEKWYDEVYLPLVQAIREQAILRYFPGRTETDFFVWLARHRAELQNELGYQIAPDVTVSRLLSRVEEAAPTRRNTLAARFRKLTKLTLPDHSPPITRRTWAQERALDRYSEHLFAGMLFPVLLDDSGAPGQLDLASLARAAAICRGEDATLCILGITLDEPSAFGTAAIHSLTRAIVESEIAGEVLVESGDPLRWIKDVGFLNDLVIINRSFGWSAAEERLPSALTRAIVEELYRPILLLGATAAEPFPERVLVVQDTRRRLNEAMFIAAYLAERWGVELTVLPLSNGRDTEVVVEGTKQYLALHEVTATFMEPIRPDSRAAGIIVQSGLDGEFDLLLLTGPDRGRKANRTNNTTEMIWEVLQHWPNSTLIAT